MSLENIVSRVEADSRAAEAGILREAEAQRDEALAAARRRSGEVLAGHRAASEAATAHLRSREEAGLEMELKKRTLASRRRTLDQAFESVLCAFAELPQDEKRRLYKAMMARAAAEIRSGKVRCRKGDEMLLSGFQGFSVGEPIDCRGGFIAVSQDGRVEVDMRFEVLLRDLWGRNLGAVSGILFGDGR
jgi:V/A-type H+-transporting ATPase subunit E